MTAFIFFILLNVPTFGGDLRVSFEVTTEDGCERLRRVVERQFQDMRFKGEITPCQPKDAFATPLTTEPARD